MISLIVICKKDERKRDQNSSRRFTHIFNNHDPTMLNEDENSSWSSDWCTASKNKPLQSIISPLDESATSTAYKQICFKTSWCRKFGGHSTRHVATSEVALLDFEQQILFSVARGGMNTWWRGDYFQWNKYFRRRVFTPTKLVALNWGWRSDPIRSRCWIERTEYWTNEDLTE